MITLRITSEELLSAIVPVLSKFAVMVPSFTNPKAITAVALLTKCEIIGSHKVPLHSNIYPNITPKIKRGRKPKNWRCKALNNAAAIQMAA